MEAIAAAVAEFKRGAHSAEAGDLLAIPDWGHKEWTALFAYTQPLELNAGEVLIQPRGGDSVLYFVASGRLELVRIDHAATGISSIANISSGSVVGELAFFDGRPRSAKVWAVTPVRLLKLTRQDFERYARDNAREALSFLFAMARLLSYRLRNPIAPSPRGLQSAHRAEY